MTDPGDDLDGTVSWRELLAETRGRLAASPDLEASDAEARWIVEEASGMEGAELLLGLDDPATVGGVARLDAMVARRLAGEPIQHVLGHWSFRRLDLLVDRRVLIPRPETEQVVEVALGMLDERHPAGRPPHPTVVDLGTGSGAIALAVASERPGARVWATDRSPDALAVARANLSALGMAGSAVRLAEGSWWDALPDELRGAVDLVVSNPPYIAEPEPLPASVRDHEPIAALVSGPTGLEAYRAIAAEATSWLAPGGAIVVEIGATQAAEVRATFAGAGLVDATVHRDLAGLDRAVAARRP